MRNCFDSISQMLNHGVALTVGTVILNCVYAFSSTNTSVLQEETSTSFKSLVLDGIFVDKSLLIEEILSRDEKVFQITRPRKWGKTINLQMLKHFFEVELDEKGEKLPEKKKVNRFLFEGEKTKRQIYPLKISKSKSAMDHFGRYPVIYLDFKEVKGDEESMRRSIVNLFSRYPFLEKYLENSSEILDDDEKVRLNNFMKGDLDEEYIFNFLEFLSMILYEHFNSYVCIFIDNYDYPLINTFLKFGDRGKEFEFAVQTFRMFYDYCFKENQYIMKAMICGTLNFELVPSGASEFEYRYISYSSVLDSGFSRFYGFTLEEVNNLLLESELKTHLNGIKEWYGGIFLNGTEMFNPQSVIKYVKNNGKFDYYLLRSHKSELASFLDRAFLSDSMQEQLHLLSEGKQIIRDSLQSSTSLRHLTGDLYSVFLHAGYLNWVLPERVTEKAIWRLRIPNLEVRGVVASGMRKWAQKELNSSCSEYDYLINALFTLKIGTFVEKLQGFLSKVDKYNQKTDENCYHNLMGGIAASLGVWYLVDSIKEYGQMRGEHVIIPLPGYGDTAINIEYNMCKPWQKIEDIVRASLEDLVHRPKTCKAKINAHSHVIRVFYVSIGFVGNKVVEKHRLVNVC